MTTLTLTSQAVLSIARQAGFSYWDLHEASAFLEIKESIWLYPDLDLDWTVRFRTAHQLSLFKLKYSEYLC